jgi:GDPmannose 4,6-dehydratase
VTNVLMSNHESPLRGPQFVTGKIARGVAAIARGDSQTLTLGNIDVQRDWSSARDIVRGMIQIMEQEFVGDVILASGFTRTLRDVVSAAFHSVGISQWLSYVVFDESLVRTEAAVRRLDVSRARTELGWVADTPLEVWIGEMVRDCI